MRLEQIIEKWNEMKLNKSGIFLWIGSLKIQCLKVD